MYTILTTAQPGTKARASTHARCRPVVPSIRRCSLAAKARMLDRRADTVSVNWIHHQPRVLPRVISRQTSGSQVSESSLNLQPNESAGCSNLHRSSDPQDYDSDWSDAGCLNSLPLPFTTGGRPTYTTNEECVSHSLDSWRSELLQHKANHFYCKLSAPRHMGAR